MSVASLFLDVLGPVVVLVAIGALAGPRLNIDLPSLSSLAYVVLGPAFVFDLFTASDLGPSTVGRLVLAGIIGMLAAVAVSFGANRAAGSTATVTSASMMTSAYGNVGNAGLAITVFALGEEALAAAGVLMLTINIVGITTGVGLATGQNEGAFGGLRKALTAPMTLAALLAGTINLFGLTPPLIVSRPIGLLGGALIPVMLFTLGLQLASTGLRRPSPDLGITIVSKLAIAPLAATAAAAALGLTGDLLGAVAIQSAMPPAVFCMLVALEHDLELERVTTAVVSTTIASLVTLPIVLMLSQA